MGKFIPKIEYMEATNPPPVIPQVVGAGKTTETAWQQCKDVIAKIWSMKWVILIVIVVVYIVYILIKGFLFIQKHKAEINKNWPKYRCRPYVLPFGGILVGPSSTNPVTNFTECMFTVHKSFYDVLKQDFVKMFGSLASVVESQNSVLQDMRNMVNYMRTSTMNLAQDVYQKIWSSYQRLAALMGVFMSSISSLLQLLSGVYNVLLYSYSTMDSLQHNPIMSVMRFFCLTGNTLIRTSSNYTKKIIDINIGDKLSGDSGTVTGVFKSKISDDIYNYKGIIVSGLHKVKENDTWIFVKDSLFATPISTSEEYIYCLNTEGHTIPVVSPIGEDIIFKDFAETGDMKIYQMLSVVLINLLNNTSTTYDQTSDNREFYQWGVSGDTKLADGRFIKDVVIADDVIATIKTKATVDLYQLGEHRMSGTQIVRGPESLWYEARDYPGAIYLGKYYDIELYQLETEDNQLVLQDGIVIRDYEPPEVQDLAKFLLQ